MDDRSNDAAAKFLAMLQGLPIDEEAVQRQLQAERIHAREERLMPFRGSVAEDVFPRLVADKLEPTFALNVMRRFMSNPEARFCVLLGGTSLGKTVAALWGLAAEGGRYVTAEQVRRAWSSDHQDNRQARYDIIGTRYLIIDDVGTEQNDHDAQYAMFEAVNGRQGGRRKTVVTGNVDREKFATRYGERTVARIEHAGGIVELDGKGLRNHGLKVVR